MPKLLFCLMGPTAIGKTAIACQLHAQLPIEIISVDSAMIYREMDIGTAKPSDEELQCCPHHLINIIDPIECYSAAQFCTDVEHLCAQIYKRGRVPLLVGGTMMYFRALQQGIVKLPEANLPLRQQIAAEAIEKGWPILHTRLAQIDAITAARIHPHDAKRIERALEVYQLTGKPLSSWLTEASFASPFTTVNLMLLPNQRQWLHQRIAIRLEEMMNAGFISEVEQLVDKWQLTPAHPSMRTVGYRQVLHYLKGAYDKEVMFAKSLAATRQLAKRQLTWLRHWPDGTAFIAENAQVSVEIMAKIEKILDNKR